MVCQSPGTRLIRVLSGLAIAPSSWYRRPVPAGERKRPGPKPKPIDPQVIEAVVQMATENPWYGYQKIAVMCRRARQPVSDEQTYQVMRQHGLLHKKRRSRRAELHPTLKLYELLPQRPNDLWQMDVTYLHIPGFGGW